MFASGYSIFAYSLTILAVIDSVFGTPYLTRVASTPNGQLLERRDVDEVVDKVHHLHGFVKREDGKPPKRDHSKDAAKELKRLDEAVDAKIRDLTTLSEGTGPLNGGLVSRTVMQFFQIEKTADGPRGRISTAFPNDPKVAAAMNTFLTNGPPFLAAIQDLPKALNPAELKVRLKAVTDLRVDLLKANNDLIAVANGRTRKQHRLKFS
ncbi:hypothetical protein Pst134EA_022726 [Puccinia striiformis f. sp. tritici]|uniref:Uncharacterized protein n=1 Tax=Puccinia striiformis f. sp. tritici PST-78 TaxID=1165861 RepID=A0A0L0UX14_9BASI|nr:hypothetical protein Pst134EA_022726 [Puccinia striiformis f. sp. tritici]KAH9455252.1 hypothetical protein Pst134EA_022726 [Puccinia striiformis f. sp. tritici]KNE91588.1 hypothetical protein PSTG_14984 [Puccinia striiformis f. sp. tritici PST-78]